MSVSKQQRPDWCPHQDCIFLNESQNAICSGRLPKPEPHGNDFNTHRLCINTIETGDGIFDLKINNTDAYTIKRHMKFTMDDVWVQERLNPTK